MNPRLAARLLATGRIAVGAFLIFRYEEAAAATFRRRRKRGDAAKLLRGLGVRDIVLGSGMNAALAGRGSVRAWALAGVAADALDFAGTLALRDELEPAAYRATLAAAAGGVAAGVLASGAES